MTTQVCPTDGMEKVLVATDGSDSCRSAVEESIRLSKACSSKLIVVAVVLTNLEYEDFIPWVVEQAEKELYENLEEIRRISSEEGVDCEISVRRGEDPYLEIINEAETNCVDMIVMGTHGRKGIKRLIRGSVTGNVIGRMPCDVLVVPPGAKINCGNILIATDGSKHGVAAALQAVSLAKKCGSSLSVVSVAPSITEVSSAEENVKQVMELAEKEGLQREGMVLQGKPHEAILGASNQKNAGLIVVGSHGRTGVMNLLMGSVTDRVISYGEAAVLVVNSLGEDRFSSSGGK